MTSDDEWENEPTGANDSCHVTLYYLCWTMLLPSLVVSSASTTTIQGCFTVITLLLL